ncbi:MAG: bacterial transcriptional activator domain-containing protein [Planctomycetes bacterium]|nr:bacterial transcriptional activator domain-containing protein [Planctomycetota bacterium]
MAAANSVTLNQAQRQLDKGQFKQALKDAKVCHRQSPGDASRQLLEQCYLARGEELQRRGLADECRHVVEELMALGPRLPELHGRLSELLVRAGLYQRFAPKLDTNADAGSAPLSMPPGLLADVAILTENGSSCPAELRDGATSIRAALEALETGEAEAALSALDVIPRSSPFADWKLFVRGLSAYYRHDTAAMKANWDRLDPQRKAARIATRLRVVADVADGQAVDGASATLGLVERAVFEGEALSPFDRLRGMLNGGDRRRIVDTLKSCVTVLGNRHRGLSDRLIELVAMRAIREGDQQFLDQLTRAVQAPARDPNWNRVRALFNEHFDEGCDEDVDLYWRKYEQDLIGMPDWREDDRRLARTLVWLRLGEMHASWASPKDSYPEEFEDDEDDGEPDHQEAADRAHFCFERARELAPEILQVWQAPINACAHWESAERKLALHQQLLDRFPEQFDSLLFMAEHYVRCDQSVEAISFLERARRLKPLDEALRIRLWVARLNAAREAALARKWAEGREHFAEALPFDPSGELRWSWLAKRSIFERKAGDLDAAEQFDREAGAAAGEPTAALLMMAIEAHRYKLPKADVRSIETDWEKRLAKKCNSRTAGLMAQTMAEYLEHSIDYTNRKTHVEQVTRYLNRASRVKYGRQELRCVCQFFAAIVLGCGGIENSDLQSRSEQLRLAAGRGLKQFPDDPYFTLFSAQAAIFSPRHYMRSTNQARDWLRQTLELAERHPDLADEWVVSEAQVQLSSLEDLEHQKELSGGPFGGAPFFDFPGFDEDDEEQDDGIPTVGSPFRFGNLEMGMFKNMFGASKKSAEAEPPPMFGEMIDELCRTSGLSREELLDTLLNSLSGGNSKSKPKKR